MAEIKQLAQIASLAGIRRDGTQLDADYFTDGQWVRFQRGRPKKMGGYSEITDELAGPIRSSLTWSRGILNAFHTFSPGAIELTLMNGEGAGSAIYERTPAGFTSNTNYVWTVDTMYDDASGSQGTIIVAHPNVSMTNIDDTTDTQVYYGIATDSSLFLPITGMSVSGGVVSIAPYLVYYGTDGQVNWTDANLPQNLTGGDAGGDRVTGAKIVKGLPLRSGSGPAALLWSLDSLVLMQWVGGDSIFRFSTISAQTSVLSQNGILEYDGAYFWVGIDRFLAYAGGQVTELPNQMNLNWFFDHLSFSNRQKVWAMKIPRFGEIWWFYPRDNATECTHAVIFNIREKTWYDCELPRSSGYYSQVFHYPAMTSSATSSKKRLTITTNSGSFVAGDTIEGTTSGATAQILTIVGTVYKVQGLNGIAFTVSETITNLSRAGSGSLTAREDLYSAFVHERGLNAIVGENENAILSTFTTSDFGYPTGGATEQNNIQGINRWTRLVRVEPDFNATGDMTLEVVGREFAQTADVTSAPLTFSPTTGKVDMREQFRQIRIIFTSNTVGGNYEMGRVIIHTEPGDVRS